MFAMQVAQDAVDRLPQRVHVQPVEANAGARALVVVAQPVDELDNLEVGPHPRRPPLESRQRLTRVGGIAAALYPAVDFEAIRPITLDADKPESALHDQAFRQLGPPPIEL